MAPDMTQTRAARWTHRPSWALGKYGRATALQIILGVVLAATLCLIPSYAKAASVTAASATFVRSSTAVLNAHVDPEGDPSVTSCQFQYVTDTAFLATAFTDLASGGAIPCVGSPPGPLTPPFTAPLDVEATALALAAGETYRFRAIVETTSSGTIGSGDQSFTTYHGPIAIIGPDGTPGTSFTANGELAFHQATRSLYVADTPSNGIFGFNASGAPSYPALAGFTPLKTPSVGTKGIAVDNGKSGSSGNIYYTIGSPDSALGHSPSGTSLPGFPVSVSGGPRAIATDSQGHIWVTTGSHKRLDEFAPTGGSAIRSITLTGFGSFQSLDQIVFDSNDDLYASLAGDIWKYTAASDYTSGSRFALGSSVTTEIAVDLSNDRVYVARDNRITEYDPSGNQIDEFATGIPDALFSGLAVDATNHFVYVSDVGNKKVRVFAAGAVFPSGSLTPVSSLTNTSATLNGSVNPQGSVLTDCHFEYVPESNFLASGFTDLSTGGSAPCNPSPGSIPVDSSPHPVSSAIVGLTSNTDYRYRLVASSKDGGSERISTFTTPGPPIVETSGSPVRSATTVRLEGRVSPSFEATEYHFEYGSQGPCDSSPCTSTLSRSAGSGGLLRLASEAVTGLVPDTTYHYRIVADNGNPDGPAFGAVRSFTTRVSDAPPAAGPFPGPPGSDRAWEQVSVPDSSGNPVIGVQGISDDGSRAMYVIAGGNALSNTGSIFTPFFAERDDGDWIPRVVDAPRSQLEGAVWKEPAGRSDLSAMVAVNYDFVSKNANIWRIGVDGSATKVYDDSSPLDFIAVSESASRVVITRSGAVDPDHPVDPGDTHLYDVTSGTPKLVSLLPADVIPSCGVGGSAGSFALQAPQPARASRWISSDGELVFFPSRGNNCGGESQLYARDVKAGQTKLISGPPVTGPDCGDAFIKATSEAVFFWTKSRLAANDSVSENGCALTTADADVYRYDLADGSFDCVTCVSPGLDADVFIFPNNQANAPSQIAVAEDGSRVYFKSPHSLLAGAAPQVGGDPVSAYRVMVESGELAYVGPIGPTASVGSSARQGEAITPDGSVIVFRSSYSDLNPLGGTDNGGTAQYYRYDDRDRSLVCVSCPLNGAPPSDQVSQKLVEALADFEVGPNLTPLSSGGDFAFATPTPLLSSDQNTSEESTATGTDIYEWRDGRLLLVTDGLINWPGSVTPTVNGVSPSGRDVFFTAPAQYTPDALDALPRLYTARIDGGIEFPLPPKPCSLEDCQGTPKGAAEDPMPSSATFSGPGNIEESWGPKRVKCRKGKRKVRRGGQVRCVKKTQRKVRAKHNRRVAR